VVTSWQGARGALAAAEAGHDAVIAIDPTLYFDHRQSTLANEPPGRGQVVSLQDVYALDPGSPPLPPAPPPGVAAPARVFTDADRAHILGLQGNLWSEHVRTEARVAAMVFPRAAAVAEAGWSAQADRDWPDFLARMPAEFARFARLGLNEDQSAFAVDMRAAPAGADKARVTLASQTGYGQIHYTLDGRPPLASSPAYAAPLELALPAQVRAASFLGERRISPIIMKELDALSVRRRTSQELTLCPGGLALNLEAPPDREGRRPVMLVQVMNACWVWPDAALDDIAQVKVTVGALPFNFQLGRDLAHIVHRPASSPAGELQVRLDGCTGELLASEPLGVARPGLTTFSAALPRRTGTHALCFAFTGERPDPIWAVDAVQLVPEAGR
jgi:hexosaminidase